MGLPERSCSIEDVKGPRGKEVLTCEKHLSMVKNEAEKGHYAKVVAMIPA